MFDIIMEKCNEEYEKALDLTNADKFGMIILR